MATGDKPNQNLFGTNYNAEEEERKKAELAAQGAMMGAGDQSFRGATGIQDIAGMQGVPQGGTLDPTQGAGDLLIGRQFNRGGPVRISDMGSLIQEPGTSAFSMEAAGQVNPMMQPQSLESFAQPQVTFRDYDVPATPPASALSVFTPGGEVKPGIDVNAITPSPETTPETAPKNALLEMLERADERQSMGLPRQAAPGIIDAPSSVVDPFTGQTIEKPTAFAADNSLPAGMTMNQAAIMNALPDQNQGMDMNQQAIANAQSKEAGQGQVPAAPTSGLTTVGGASLSEFLSGQAMPERGFTEAERPLGGRGVTLSPERMDELSAEREARLDARLPGDQSVSDRERRAARGDGISMADLTDMAKANARGATPREVARGNQVANALGVDLKTGQPLQTAGGLTFDQQLALRKQNFAEGKFDYELAKDAQATYTAGIEASQKATTEEAQADTAGRTMVSAISNMNDAMTRMGGRSGEFFGSGFFGKAASFMPGTYAYDQVADVEFLQSNVALNAMSELKELSPTGSTGFGALSEKELRVLTDKYANLNPFTSPGLFQSNLKQLQGEFNNMLDNAWNKHSKEYSPEAANAIYGNRGGSGATGAPSQAVPNDRNVASAADTLLSDPKYN